MAVWVASSPIGEKYHQNRENGRVSVVKEAWSVFGSPPFSCTKEASSVFGSPPEKDAWSVLRDADRFACDRMHGRFLGRHPQTQNWTILELEEVENARM